MNDNPPPDALESRILHLQNEIEALESRVRRNERFNVVFALVLAFVSFALLVCWYLWGLLGREP